MIERSARGFTLIELLIFIVVVSLALTGILLTVNTVVKSSADPLIRKQTVAIAASLLEEILLKEYANPPDGYTGTSRAQFDDVSDYAGYGTTAGIVDTDGVAVAGLAAYNIAPPVRVVATSELTGVAAFKVTVSVTGPLGPVSVSGYRSAY